MKKNFPVGNWFPSPLETTKIERTIESSQNNNNASPQFLHPFQIVPSKTEALQVNVAYGSVNTQVPSEVAPLVSQGTSFSVSDGTKLYLKATIGNEGELTAVSIQKDEPTDDDDTAGKLIGEVLVENGVIVAIGQAIITSLGLFSCGENHYWINS